jgi:diguanylate cyclase (GGDEF)-like protein
MIYAWFKDGRLGDLFFARHHTPYLTRHRLIAIDTRTKLVAAAFSVLTLAWIVFDALTLLQAHWEILAVFRIVAAIVFALIVIAPERQQSRARTLTLLGIMLAMPLMIFCVAQVLFAGAALTGLAHLNVRLYEALPLIVLAGLSIFPLVVSEGVAFAGVIAVVVAEVQVNVVGTDAVDLFSTLWTLALSLGVYLLACAIQLHYMMALLRRASYDPLTSALTRRSGLDILDLHFGIACDRDAPLSLLFIDADNFKSINDKYGHDAGDQALKGIAQTLHDDLRQADAVIRWGGEEFLVILTDTPMSGAEVVVGRLSRHWFGTRPDGAPLTASMGLAERKADGVVDWAQLVSLADSRMYAAKQAGKARCVNHQGVVDTPRPDAVAAPSGEREPRSSDRGVATQSSSSNG